MKNEDSVFTIEHLCQICSSQVECTECGLQIPTNTIKRHRQKHEKDAEKVKNAKKTMLNDNDNIQAKLLAENPSLAIPPPKPVSTKKKVLIF